MCFGAAAIDHLLPANSTSSSYSPNFLITDRDLLSFETTSLRDPLAQPIRSLDSILIAVRNEERLMHFWPVGTIRHFHLIKPSRLTFFQAG